MDQIVFKCATGKQPKWMMSVYRDEDGTIYVPAAAFGNENAVGMCASYDGVRAITCDRHLYLPTSWIIREYPSAREQLEKLESTIAANYE